MSAGAPNRRPRAEAAEEPPAPVDELPEGEPGIPEEPPAPEAPGYDEDPWLDDERDEVPADESLQPPRRPAREDVLEETPGLPPGDAGARPPVVRAEAAARLRLG